MDGEGIPFRPIAPLPEAGAITEISQIADRLHGGRGVRLPFGTIPRFDQRPGTLEATRGLKPHVRFLGVLGDHAPQGWRIVLQLEVEGEAVHLPVAAGEARRLAGELRALADLVEFGVDGFCPAEGA